MEVIQQNGEHMLIMVTRRARTLYRKVDAIEVFKEVQVLQTLLFPPCFSRERARSIRMPKDRNPPAPPRADLIWHELRYRRNRWRARRRFFRLHP